MYTRDQIVNILRNKKPDLQTRYPIAELGDIWLLCQGDNNSDSDIDMLVVISMVA